jgi:hypothetical protein
LERNKLKGEDYRRFDVLLTRYNSGDKVKKTEMGRRYSTNGEEETCTQGFSGKT